MTYVGRPFQLCFVEFLRAGTVGTPLARRPTPRDALDAFMTVYLVGIGKKDGGTRVLGQGGAARRKLGRAAARTLTS